MSLVAYAASSDEDSDCESQKDLNLPEHNSHLNLITTSKEQIVDERNDEQLIKNLFPIQKIGATKLVLPNPKHNSLNTIYIENINEQNATPTFYKLPTPKCNTKKTNSSTSVIEEDDEFLHKKNLLIDDALQENFSQKREKKPVLIKIPALTEFQDVDKELSEKLKTRISSATKIKGSRLLDLLPIAKSEQNFMKPTNNENIDKLEKSIPSLNVSAKFVPDTVTSRRPAYNTEGIDGLSNTSTKKRNKQILKNRISLVNCSDSESSGDEDGKDFFSLNTTEDLPQVSSNEINTMIAKCAAKMAEKASNFLNKESEEKRSTDEYTQHEDGELHSSNNSKDQSKLNAEAVQALEGSSAKRRRKQQRDIQIMDISSDQVLPDKNEWMRTALASSTAYQPTGVLVDEEPSTGTRRKHHITFLAHKAKANEAELQAMWAANRQNRRATQSKYGF